MSRKQRLDQMLVDRGLVESRTRAQALVMAGLVFSGERKLEKPGQQIAADTPLDVRGRDHPWVSRGGAQRGATRLGSVGNRYWNS
jgi:23S rRNA (cytidine1920-2'-O)/16S rRNA (cytidine1409-2'-O)-methyltransferase